MKIDYELACQDGCLNVILPSDLRQLVCERDQAYRNIDILKSELDALREQLKLAVEALHESQDWDWLAAKDVQMSDEKFVIDEMQRLWDLKVKLTVQTSTTNKD